MTGDHGGPLQPLQVAGTVASRGYHRNERRYAGLKLGVGDNEYPPFNLTGLPTKSVARARDWARQDARPARQTATRKGYSHHELDRDAGRNRLPSPRRLPGRASRATIT